MISFQHYIKTIAIFSLIIGSQLFASPIKNSFDLSNSSIPADKILQGGAS